MNVGHRHVGLLASPPGAFEKNLAYAHALFRGVATAVKSAGLAFHGRPMEATVEGIERALDALFEEQPSLTALIVHNEGMIDLVMHALSPTGKRVPAQVSVVTVEVSELTRHAVRSLTHVSVPAVEMGRTAVRLLAEGGPGIRCLPRWCLAAPWRALARLKWACALWIEVDRQDADQPSRLKEPSTEKGLLEQGPRSKR